MLIELSGPGKTSLWYTDNAGRRHITVSARGLLTNREWRNGFQLRKMEAVFSRLFNSANAVSGSAGLVPYRLAALLRKETPLTALPQYLQCLACDCQSQAVTSRSLWRFCDV